MSYQKAKIFFKHLFKKNNIIRHSNPNDTNSFQNKLIDYYQPLIQHHPSLTLIFSLEGEVISGNKSKMNKYLGYRSKQKVTFQKLLPHDSNSSLKKAFTRASQGNVEQVEFNVFDKQGEKLDVIGTFIPIEISPPKIEAILLMLEDVTIQKQLETSHETHTIILEKMQKISNIGCFEYNIQTDKINCSKSFVKLLGIKKNKNISIRTLLSSVHQEDRDEVFQLLNQAITDGNNFSAKFRVYYRKTKEIHYVKMIVEIIEKHGQPFQLIGVIEDETEQTLLNRQFIELNDYYQSIFDHLNAGIWMKNSNDGKIIFASRGLEKILRIPFEKLCQKPDEWKNMILPEYRTEIFKKHRLLKKGEIIGCKYRLEDGEGTTKWVYEQIIPRVNDLGEVTHLFGMMIDISSEMEMQQKLAFIEKYDSLTALPNRHSLYKKLDYLINNNSKKFALLYIDIDNFSWLNDYFGHDIGDKVLKKIANRFVTMLPPSSYLSKVDSDEFIIIIPNDKNKDVIFQLVEKVIRAIAKKMVIEDYELYTTISIGISFYPDDGRNKLTLLENAHTALYYAKKYGKNNYHIYSDDKEINIQKKYILSNDLRKAIQNNEFEIYYQPQVNPINGIIVGAEALIRWNHKEWGVVPPDEFIPLAEKKHLIHDISDLVIKKVCKQLQTWMEKEYQLCPISINISPLRFFKPGLVDTLKNELDYYQIPPKYLELEITESSLLKYDQNISEILSVLKRLGVRIALDDFGTRYSTFYYLQTFHLDTLKIDQIFIQNLDLETKQETKEMAIVSSLLQLAKGLNMKVVAEGVEEYEQLEFLKQKQCDTIQGYIYSKPVPVNKFEQMLQTGYLKPKKQKKSIKIEEERRKYFRFSFPFHMPATMRITEVNNRKVNMGRASILVENISLGGIRFLSTLRLPISTNLKLNFQFKIMNRYFEIDGTLIYQNEETQEVYAYGASFLMTEGEKDKLAEIINKMTILRRLNDKIPDTEFIEENPYLFLRNQSNKTHHS